VSRADIEIALSVAEHGWHAIAIEDGPVPPFVYTCGLMTTWAAPEMVIFGLPARSAHSVLAAMVEHLRSGIRFESDRKYRNILQDRELLIRTVHPSQHELYLGFAMGHVRHMAKAGSLSAIQVLWPDRSGSFPGDHTCEPFVSARQPALHLPVIGLAASASDRPTN
jgi:hypothetical protein